MANTQYMYVLTLNGGIKADPNTSPTEQRWSVPLFWTRLIKPHPQKEPITLNLF